MEIEGRIILDLPLQTGTSKAGKPWKKKEWVLETFGSYPRKVKFHIFGDRVDTIRLEPGKDYVLSFDLESREFNGKWYTDVSVYQARDYVPQGYPQGAPAASPGYGISAFIWRGPSGWLCGSRCSPVWRGTSAHIQPARRSRRRSPFLTDDVPF